MEHELKPLIENLQVQMDQRFDQVDQRFDQVDQRFEKVEHRLDGHDARLDQLDTSLRHTHVLIEDLRGQVATIAEGFASLDDKLSNVVRSVELAMRREMAPFKLAHQDLRHRVDDHERRLRRLEPPG